MEIEAEIQGNRTAGSNAFIWLIFEHFEFWDENYHFR